MYSVDFIKMTARSDSILRYSLFDILRFVFNIEPAHKLKIDQNKLQNCRSNILNLVNVL
ncbi:hypothetical protein D1AOALGA4SA_5718 [Olavius algarvensis Delta 1 endosymbiont]|nr:hypothetical protein D1AOALGA4SA_5718 [Olavius algarvensis Delta 1 endosymbiont]